MPHDSSYAGRGRVPPEARWLAGGLVIALIAAQWMTTGQAYFVEWATAEPTQRIYNADYRAAAAYLSHSASVEPAFIGSDRQLDLDQRTYQLYNPARRDARWFYLPDNPPLPREGGARYLLPGDADLPPILTLLAPAATTDETLTGPTGNYVLLRALRISSDAVDGLLAQGGAQPFEIIPAYGDALRLTAAGVQNNGEELGVITRMGSHRAVAIPAAARRSADAPQAFRLALRCHGVSVGAKRRGRADALSHLAARRSAGRDAHLAPVRTTFLPATTASGSPYTMTGKACCPLAPAITRPPVTPK